MQITIDVEKVDGLFLKQEIGTASIGDEEMTFGICLPTGAPYVYVRGEYYVVQDIFQKILRAAYEQENHEEHLAPCDEHVAQPASTPQPLGAIASRDHDGAVCPGGVDICAGGICTHKPDAAGPDEG